MHDKIHDFFDKDTLMSIFSSLLGFSDLMAKHLFERNLRGEEKLSVDLQYALVQHISLMRLLHYVLNDKLEKEELTCAHMPTGGNSWKDEADFEKRFIFVVKEFYRRLKDEGKINE